MYQSGLLLFWVESEEYGHGLMVVGVLAYLAYRRWDSTWIESRRDGWLCIPLAGVAFVFAISGEASGIHLISYYSIWLFAVATMLGTGGARLVKKLLFPLLIVLLLFPLPNPYGPMLTSKLQLISSMMGVWFIRTMGGSVYLEGNVLDMGAGIKLLVAEACAGLRYLFPLMSLGAIAAYIIRAPSWIRIAIFLVTIPITLVMNSIRIAVTGLLVEGGNTTHTEGILHLFEGWVVFVVASVILWVVAWGLIKLQPGSPNLSDVLFFEAEKVVDSGDVVTLPTQHRQGADNARLWGVAAFALIAALSSGLLAARVPATLDRKPLSEFPMQIGDWVAHEDRLPPNIEAVAGASEYYYGDFHAPSGGVVNVYIAYYSTQRHGQVPHSPKVCIPGAGWTIESNSPVIIPGGSGNLLKANRILSTKGDRKAITYYWLKQGSTSYNQEFITRLNLIKFSLLENRTDGALIRLVTDVMAGESLEAAESRLMRFSPDFVSIIPTYVPD
jgi:exosortase D (VPLPA-CTERM-specific)